MARNLNAVIADLPAERQEQIDEQYKKMKSEIGSLSELREISGRAQSDVAAALNIKQPSISKIEKQADMHLSTLRDYVKAIGGELELVVRLPKHRTVRIGRLGTTPPLGKTAQSETKRKTRGPGRV